MFKDALRGRLLVPSVGTAGHGRIVSHRIQVWAYIGQFQLTIDSVMDTYSRTRNHKLPRLAMDIQIATPWVDTTQIPIS